MTYTHSKDYLIELANNSQTQGWLKDLIIKIINSNGIFLIPNLLRQLHN